MSQNSTNVATDNVVGRLYNLIYALKKTNGNSENAFCTVFSLEEGDRCSILSNYAELFKMCALGINEIVQLQPKNIKKYKDTLNNVIDGLATIYFNSNPGSLNNGMDKFKSYFSKEVMLSLEYCADYLSEYSKEVNIEDEKINELIKEINDLIDFVLSYNLDGELKKILIYQLNNVRESLLKYKLYGAQGIINSISTTLGTLILSRDRVNSDNDKISVERVFQVMGKINAIFSFKNNSTNILGEIYKRITGKD